MPESFLMPCEIIYCGWGGSHGDDEIISTEQALSWFDIAGIGKSAARFDPTRLESLNARYIKTLDEAALLNALGLQVEKYFRKAPG